VKAARSKKLLPEVARLWGVPQPAEYHPEVDTGVHLMMVLDMSAQLEGSLAVRFACLCHDLGKGTTPADVLPRHIGHEERSARLLKGRVRTPARAGGLPRDRRRGGARARQHPPQRKPGRRGRGALLERCDAFRKPQRFAGIAAGLRMRRARPPGPARFPLPAARRVCCRPWPPPRRWKHSRWPMEAQAAGKDGQTDRRGHPQGTRQSGAGRPPRHRYRAAASRSRVKKRNRPTAIRKGLC
jgi:tRNA nucleotidyltransferase (CCA-adding enzyme)